MKKRLGDVISVAPWSSLDLSCNPLLGEIGKGDEGARMISELMNNNTTITSLNLEGV